MVERWFCFDRLVKSVIHAGAGLMPRMLPLLHIQALDRLILQVCADLRLVMDLVDKVTLAHCFDTPTDNLYEATRWRFTPKPPHQCW